MKPLIHTLLKKEYKHMHCNTNEKTTDRHLAHKSDKSTIINGKYRLEKQNKEFVLSSLKIIITNKYIK